MRWYSSSSNGGLFRTFVENLRKSLEKDKEIQENLKAFEDERSKIVKSDSVKMFRQQFSNTRVSKLSHVTELHLILCFFRSRSSR